MTEEHRRRRRLRRGLSRLVGEVGPDLERHVGELEPLLWRLEGALNDLGTGAASPPGFSPTTHLAPGVPRIRPLLVFLAARAAGDEMPSEHEVASAAELLHLAVAVHDAALGRQGGRRRRVARRLLGGAAHWLGGNHLTLRSLELARSSDAPEILGEVLDALREIGEGHALAEDLRHRDPSEADYRDFAEVHTGAVFAFCTRAGGHLAGAPRPMVTALGRYGRHMGVAWHALEDQWCFDSDPEQLLRYLAHRAATGRPMLPLIRALERDPEVDALLDHVLVEGEPSDAAVLAERVVAAGGLGAVKQLVVTESFAARRALRTLPETPHREILDRLARGLVTDGQVPTAM